jgi:hypothetical protein
MIIASMCERGGRGSVCVCGPFLREWAGRGRRGRRAKNGWEAECARVKCV